MLTRFFFCLNGPTARQVYIKQQTWPAKLRPSDHTKYAASTQSRQALPGCGFCLSNTRGTLTPVLRIAPPSLPRSTTQQNLHCPLVALFRSAVPPPAHCSAVACHQSSPATATGEAAEARQQPRTTMKVEAITVMMMMMVTMTTRRERPGGPGGTTRWSPEIPPRSRRRGGTRWTSWWTPGYSR